MVPICLYTDMRILLYPSTLFLFIKIICKCKLFCLYLYRYYNCLNLAILA